MAIARLFVPSNYISNRINRLAVMVNRWHIKSLCMTLSLEGVYFYERISTYQREKKRVGSTINSLDIPSQSALSP